MTKYLTLNQGKKSVSNSQRKFSSDTIGISGHSLFEVPKKKFFLNFFYKEFSTLNTNMKLKKFYLEPFSRNSIWNIESRKNFFAQIKCMIHGLDVEFNAEFKYEINFKIALIYFELLNFEFFKHG